MWCSLEVKAVARQMGSIGPKGTVGVVNLTGLVHTMLSVPPQLFAMRTVLLAEAAKRSIRSAASVAPPYLRIDSATR